jgi:FkbH-like protein
LSIYSELAWLPNVNAQFGADLKKLSGTEESVGKDLQRLATHALDLNGLIKLAKAAARLRTERGSLSPLVPFRLAVLSNGTIDFIMPALVGSALRHGIDLEIIRPSYDQVAQEALNPNSHVNQSKPDAVLLALDYRALPLKLAIGSSEAAEAAVEGALGYLQTLCQGISSISNAVCIVQSFAPPAEVLFGSLDAGAPGTIKNMLGRLNQELFRFARSSGHVVLDIAGLAETVGLGNWHDPKLWNMAKLPFADEYVPLYADHVARVVAAIRGKSRKALVLDLDNTLWGGVIGDDGLEGIKIAQGDAAGEAHLAVQRLALDLRRRGILLAVSSKNTVEVARTPFLQHPEMLLKLDHIAVFQANWDDKATNIQAIAEELDLGLDALVFLDDNPVERGLVRQLLPQVAVPELPDEPALYARTLAAAGYFEAIAFAAEDLQRASYYQENVKRASLQKQMGGVEAYLASLDMTITFQPFDAMGRARIVQLINKSNQYNLTARRYTEPEVLAAESDPNVFTLQVRLSDTFGDNGMISVVICRPAEPSEWRIDTWLMSCRVLERRIEYMVLREVLEHARRSGIDTLVGIFIPSERNQMVAEHYAKLGFAKTRVTASGTTEWKLSVDGAIVKSAPMNVVSHGFKDSEATI